MHSKWDNPGLIGWPQRMGQVTMGVSLTERMERELGMQVSRMNWHWSHSVLGKSGIIHEAGGVSCGKKLIITDGMVVRI